MVLSTGVSFALAGAWLAVTAPRTLRGGWPLALPAATCVISLVVLLEYAAGVDLGVDAPALHAWLPVDAQYPGRMSAFTAIGFLAAGVTMILEGRPAGPRTDVLALALATTSGAVGVLAMLGYLFELHLVYARYALGLIAVPTAIGLVVLGVALWLRLLGEGRIHFWEKFASEDRITFSAAAILSLTSLAAAVIVFAALEGRVTQTLREELATSLRYRVLLAESAIEAGLQRTRILSGRPAPARSLRRHGEHPGDPEALAQLSQSVTSLVADGYLAAVYYDVHGAEIVAAGQRLRDPDLSVGLLGAPGATLAWQGRFVVSARYPIADARGDTGAALVQATLPALDELLHDPYRLGATGEGGMCVRIEDRLGCFPQPRIPKVYSVPVRAADGSLLPMTRGVSGEIGVVVTRDYRGENVMAAYAPVGAYGLGMVAKVDTAEIYAPVRERLQILLPALVVLIAAGTLLLRMRVRPLIARLAESERDALQQHRALEAMMANVADGMMMLDVDGTIRSWNTAAERLFGYSAAEVVGRNLSMLVPEELREANIAATRRLVATGNSNVIDRANLNYPARRKDGSRFELEGTVTRTGGGDIPHLVAIFRDITERKQAERQLARLALHDPLTGLPNRASFEQRVEEALPRRRKGGGHLALMMMDMDKFKSINDSLGHGAGDLLLVAFARRIQGALREEDLIARLGGDEFTIVAENLKSADDAVAIAEKVLGATREPFDIEGLALVVTTSIGIALYRDGDTAESLMKRADSALYEAKSAGRARYRIAS